MQPLRRRSWGMAGSSILRRSWSVIRKPFVKACGSWRRQRMQRRGASEKKGGTPAANGRTAGPRSEPPPPVAGVHGWRSDARRRAVDQPVTARVITTAVGAGYTCESPHDPTTAEKTQPGPPHGAEEKDDGPP